MVENNIDRIKSSDEKFCRECASIIKIDADICSQCGTSQSTIRSVITLGNEKNRIVAILLALFLGGLGVHKFYLGQTFWGVIYLLFCWTLIPTFVSFVEFILLLIMRDDVFDRKFNKH